MENNGKEMATIELGTLFRLYAAETKLEIIERMVYANDTGNRYDSVNVGDLCNVLGIERDLEGGDK